MTKAHLRQVLGRVERDVERRADQAAGVGMPRRRQVRLHFEHGHDVAGIVAAPVVPTAQRGFQAARPWSAWPPRGPRQTCARRPTGALLRSRAMTLVVESARGRPILCRGEVAARPSPCSRSCCARRRRPKRSDDRSTSRSGAFSSRSTTSSAGPASGSGNRPLPSRYSCSLKKSARDSSPMKNAHAAAGVDDSLRAPRSRPDRAARCSSR